MIKFGTDGWRAVIAEEFTYDNLRKVVSAVAGYLKTMAGKPSVLIGYDNRFMGREFAQAAGRVLAEEGIKVVIGQEAYPTPAIAYAVKARRVDGAIMLTASHNPYYFNGLKFIPDYAGPATAEITDAIEQNIKAGRESGVKSQSGESFFKETVKKEDLSREYVANLISFVDADLILEKQLAAAVDPFHGAGFKLLPELTRSVGIRTVAIRDSADPLFEGGLPDPSEQNLKRLSEVVRKEKCDAGLALDGDGDRFGIINEKGAYLSPNQVAALVLKHMVKNRGAKGAAVRTVATTHLIDAIAEGYGLEVIETPVGFKHIGKLMREKAIVMGGEESGGLSVLGHIPEKDGMLADLLIMEMIAVEGKPLSEIWREVTTEYGEFYNDRLDIHLTEEKKRLLLENLIKKAPSRIGSLKVKSVEDKDGVCLLLEKDAWLLVRPSGTEPVVRIYIEARDVNEFSNLEKAAKAMAYS